ncbi:MAG TPA: thiamine ABC transporter substrate-binding protein [Acidimicrobiales bacterium]|nr:thiamine ABC transporter substrate-binding protein [Acidimicrobiales bacterium]
MIVRRPLVASLVVGIVALAATACGDDSSSSAGAKCFDEPATPAISSDSVKSANIRGTKITLVTHDSFALSDGTLEEFTAQTGVEVELLRSNDAGAMVSQAVITSGKPTADVMFGVDNTFLCKALEANVFVPYESPALADVAEDLQLDTYHRVTPMDVGDVCVNYWKESFGSGAAPASFDDLTKPEFKGQFVTEHPDTSSPGFAFLLATIAKYGDDGWEGYWRKLRDNNVAIAPGWTEAYGEQFKSGGGDKSIVTSYASSPAAEVVFSEGKLTEPPTGVVNETCFRQIEFAGVLRGSEHPEAAAALVDFLLSDTVQNDIPLNMFVFPASKSATLPAEFSKHAKLVDKPLTLDPATIESNRIDWTERWAKIALR